jgi:hypothetical protein
MITLLRTLSANCVGLMMRLCFDILVSNCLLRFALALASKQLLASQCLCVLVVEVAVNA